MESSLATSNPVLYAKVLARMGPTLDRETAPAERSPEPSPFPPASTDMAAAVAEILQSEAVVVAPAAALALAPIYSNAAMVELMVGHPGWTGKQFAKHFGKGSGWFATVLASDSFQLELDKRRAEVTNPSLTATMEERFRALALRSLDVLQDKLDSSEVSDNIVLRAAEIGVKALGMGQVVPQAPVQQSGSVESLAERLVAAFERQRGNVRKPVVLEVDVTDAVVVAAPPTHST